MYENILTQSLVLYIIQTFNQIEVKNSKINKQTSKRKLIKQNKQ
jgi:hypothetical protein